MIMKKVLAAFLFFFVLVLPALGASGVWQMRQSGVLIANARYAPIRTRSLVRTAYFDARKKTTRGLADLFRRYDDVIVSTSLSELSAADAPTHIFVVANRMAEAAQAVQKIDSDRPQVVLLLAGLATATDTLPTGFDAVFYLPSTEKDALDALVQAAFSGSAVSLSGSPIPFAFSGLQPRQQAKTRLGYASPDDEQMNSQKLAQIDKVAAQMISSKASPGAYVLVARNGEVVFSKPYGTATYNSRKKIDNYMLYDLASVSKAIGTLPIVMQLFNDGLLAPTTTLGTFFPELAWEKQCITVEQLLLHMSGLPASVAAFLTCADSSTIEKPLYSAQRKSGFSVQIEPQLFIRDGIELRKGNFSTKNGDLYTNVVARNLFATDTIPQLVLAAVDNAKMLKPIYRYSDLNFIYLQRIAEQILESDLDVLFLHNVARPLGIKRLTYCPLRFFAESETVETENDRYFRHQQLRGTVHDQTAALLGGVAGNAGLFGTANEIAKICQLYLNRGEYGSVRLFSGLTVDNFTKQHDSECRRGYGFDKPEARKGKSSPVTAKASLSSYGHSGFSGTLFWIDPEEQLIFIFLSNRICPDAYNNQLTKDEIRTRIHQIIYNSIDK